LRKIYNFQVVALGEIGLDYSGKNGVDHCLQKEVFAAQLKIAIRMGLPVCLHIRDATDDGIEGNYYVLARS
jgi:TatD DNase family protein